MSDNEFRISISAELDKKVDAQIQSDLNKIDNLNVNVGKVNIDNTAINKATADVKKQLSILERSINMVTQDLMDFYKIDSSNTDAFDKIKQALIDIRKELNNTNIDGKLKSIDTTGVERLTKIISQNMKVVKQTTSDYQDLLEYIQQVNKSGQRVYIPKSITQEYGDDYARMRASLGKMFTSDSSYKSTGTDFETFINELNSQLGNVIDTSHGAEQAFADLLDKLKSAKNVEYFSPEDVEWMIDSDELSKLAAKSINDINEVESELKKMNLDSVSEVQNQQKQIREEYQKTIKTLDDLIDKDNLVKKQSRFDGEGNFTGATRTYNPSVGKTTVVNSDAKGNVLNFTKNTDFAKIAKEAEKAQAKINNVVLSAKEFIATMKTNNGEGIVNRESIKAVQDYVDWIKETDDIDLKIDLTSELEQQIKEAKIDVKNFNATVTNSTKSFNNIKNAVIDMENMDSTIQNINDRFKGLIKQPKELADKIASLNDKAKKVNEATTATDKWRDAYLDLQKTVTEVKDEIKSIATTKYTDEQKVAYDEIIEKQNEINKLKLQRLDSEKNESEVITERIAKLEEEKKAIYDTLDAKGLRGNSDSNYEKELNSIQELYEWRKKLHSAQTNDDSSSTAEKELEANLKKQVEYNKEILNVRTQIANVEATLRDDGTKTANLQERANALQEELNKLQQQATAYSDILPVEAQQLQVKEELIQAQLKYNSALKNAQSTKDDKTLILEQRKKNALASAQVYLQKNTKLSKESLQAFHKLMVEMSEAPNLKAFDDVNRRMTEMKTNFKVTGEAGLSNFSLFFDNFTKFSEWFSVNLVFTKIKEGIVDVLTTIKEVDDAMVSLRKVTELTDKQYSDFLTSAIKQSKELGASISDTIEMVAQWSKLGYSVEDAQTLASASTIYANVGDIENTEDAVSDLITIMKAYGYEAENVMEIVDRLNELGNKYSTSASGLGEMLRNSASAMKLAGNSIDQTLALGTAMTEIIQDESEAGNTLKILSLRLRGKNDCASIYGNIYAMCLIKQHIDNNYIG